MAHFMLQGAYAQQAWQSLIKNPQDRAAVVSDQLRKLGCRMINFYYSFGEYDTLIIFEAPDEVTAAAFAVTVAAPGGLLKSAKTTVLLSPEMGVEAMRKAGAAPYQVRL